MRYILLLAFTSLFLKVQAQQMDFQINGKIDGKQLFNYAFVYDNESQLIAKTKIIDGNFVIKGTYSQKQRFNEIPFATVILSNDDNDTNIKRFSKKLNNQVIIILGEHIELTYENDKKHFKIDGGLLNDIQQEFQDVYWAYRCKRDSISAQIDMLPTQEGDKNDQKTINDRTLFSIAVNKLIPIILKYPDSEVALFNIGPVIYDQSIPSTFVTEIFNKLALKDSEYGQHIFKDLEDKIIQEEITANPAYTTGMVMPVFELPNAKKNLIRSDSIYGKYTLIDFWATWCTPCRLETPNLRLALAKFQKNGFGVITISLDIKSDLQIWLNALKDDEMENFTNLIGDSKSTIVKELKISAIPANYLINENGKIIAINLRGDELQKKLKDLMP